ncbi:hypothetical protein NQZ68_000723 [Dissostichus eleginoides]|nr:hypothetical protein NQZ68_000723 [Dissostichus eleginoides]
MWSRPEDDTTWLSCAHRGATQRGSQLPLSLVLRCGVRGESPEPAQPPLAPPLSPNDTRAWQARQNAGSAETESPPAAAHAQRRARRGAPRPDPKTRT